MKKTAKNKRALPKTNVVILTTGEFYGYVLSLAKQRSWASCVFSTYGIKRTPEVTKIMEALAKVGRKNKGSVVGFIGGSQSSVPYGNDGIEFYRYLNVHSKFFAFDNGNMVVGSHNLTASGWLDISVGFRDEKKVSEFIDHFQRIKQKNTKKDKALDRLEEILQGIKEADSSGDTKRAKKLLKKFETLQRKIRTPGA